MENEILLCCTEARVGVSDQIKNSGPCFQRSYTKKILLLLFEMSYIQLFIDKYTDLFTRKMDIPFT